MTSNVTQLQPASSVLDEFADVTAANARKGTRLMDELEIDKDIAAYILKRIRTAYLKKQSSLTLRTGVIRGAVTRDFDIYIYGGTHSPKHKAIKGFDAEGFRIYLTEVVDRHITDFKLNFGEEHHNGQTVHVLTITW